MIMQWNFQINKSVNQGGFRRVTSEIKQHMKRPALLL